VTARHDALDGRRVLVTGGGSGIGAAISRAVALAGATVAVNDLVEERAAEVGGEIAASGLHAVAIPGDVSTEDGASSVVGAAIDALGGLDGLVNNVGIVRGGPLATLALSEWELTFRVDVTSALLCSQAALPALRESKGAIVNTSSLVAIAPAPGAGAYNAAKAALASLTQHMALEWGPDGIRVNALAPGLISGTRFSASSTNPEVQARRQPVVPLRRTGTAEDVAPVAVFLLSEAAGYVTGHLLVVDGGLAVALQSFIPG
jgi:NAD(P)-dependent dehydrogenase (short-subunit alcohol dehydrogenase family)